MGLVFVPTPIGNLRDITLRAIDVLRDCRLVVAEDTRTARRLFNALDLPAKPLVSYREQNAGAVTAAILAAAATDLVAVVTDAGTPAISDPGRDLVVAARSAGVAVEVLPGPCAFVVAAVLSGFPLAAMTFAGFLPRRSTQRDEVLSAALAGSATTVFYESPSRIVATLRAIEKLAPEAELFLARELTKRFEQQILGTATAIALALEVPVRGEIALTIAPRSCDVPKVPATGDDIDAAIDAEVATGTSVSTAAKRIAKALGANRNDVYDRIVARKAERAAR